jgi:DNA primase small subunit
LFSAWQVNLGTDKNKDVHLPYPLHPMLQRAYNVLEPMFIEQVLPKSGHGLLASPDQWNALLETIPEQAIRDKLSTNWSKPKCNSTPVEKWREILINIDAYLSATKKSSAGKAAKHGSNRERERVEQWKYQTVFRYTYPRLDINVSKMRNHLLKSPFCVHPKTGRVCVPIQAEEIDAFDPFAVPTLGQLMNELDAFDKQISDSGGDDDTEKPSRPSLPNWKKTSLKPYFEAFVKKFLDPLQKEIRSRERDDAEREAAATGIF